MSNEKPKDEEPKARIDLPAVILTAIALTWCLSTVIDVVRGRTYADGCGCFTHQEEPKK
jgi:hypothetical protein